MAHKSTAPKKSKYASRKGRYEVYRKSNRRAVNKLLKVERHKKKHPNDNTVVGTVPNYKAKAA